MPTISQTINFRNRRRFKENQHPWTRLALGSAIFLSLLGAVTSLAILWYYFSLVRDLPSIDVLPSLLEPPDGTLLQPTRLYDRTSQHVILTLENPASAGRQYLYVQGFVQAGTDQFPQDLINATISELDPGFWDHPGYTLAGLSASTHPTIAQRLISDLLLEAESPSLRRNIRERLLAAQVTSRFGREKILEWYLNSAKYGELIYGADSAARAYFGKSAVSLSLAEAAMLTVLAETPSIDPFADLQSLKKQQGELIQQMLENGLVNSDQAQQAFTEEVQFQAQPQLQSISSAFTSLVLQQLSSVLPLERLQRGGNKIVTSLDYDLQLQAVCAAEVQVARLQGLPGQNENSDGGPCEAAQLLPTLQDKQGDPVEDIGVNLVVLDPKTGQVLALLGGDNSGMDSPYSATHPAGTILSPFLYLAAFSHGMSPASLLWDIPVDVGTGRQESAQNEQSQAAVISYHGPVRLRIAMVNDYSAATESVIQQVGAEGIWQTFKSFGISAAEIGRPSNGTLEDIYSQQLSLLEAVQVYAVFANQGVMAGQPIIADNYGYSPGSISPSSILYASGANGKVWLDWTVAQSRSIITPQLAYLTTDVLSDDNARQLNSGHSDILKVGRPAGVKVGMTPDGANAWVVGYTPQLAVGIWMGRSPRAVGGLSGEMPSGLWHALIEYASRQMSVEEFLIPEEISKIQVCDPSGLLVSAICPAVVEEVFLPGNEPTQVDNLYQKYYVDRENGSLATVFTPSDRLEQKVYLVVPASALAWAKQAGLPIPPDRYDPITVTQTGSSNVHISAPLMFDHVHGQITFRGSAAGNDFSYYRLQVGQGLYPQKWIQVGEDVTTPVQNGILGTWDTAGVEGSYIVQLLVVRQDQRIEQAYMPLTIDNTPPQISLNSPAEGERFAYQAGGKIMLQALASDNLGVERVEFYIDGDLVTTLWQPFFVALWPMQVGEHRLSARVYDLAGNMSQSESMFVVGK